MMGLMMAMAPRTIFPMNALTLKEISLFFLQAARRGDIEEAERTLQEMALHSTSPRAITRNDLFAQAIYEAARQGDVLTAGTLRDFWDASDQGYSDLLRRCARNNDPSLWRTFTHLRLNATQRRECLGVAALNGHLEVVHVLVESALSSKVPADPDFLADAVVGSAATGQTRVLDFLMTLPEPMWRPFCAAGLIKAASHHHTACVERLWPFVALEDLVKRMDIMQAWKALDALAPRLSSNDLRTALARAPENAVAGARARLASLELAGALPRPAKAGERPRL